jgi:hypothetical protein
MCHGDDRTPSPLEKWPLHGEKYDTLRELNLPIDLFRCIYARTTSSQGDFFRAATHRE